MASTTLGTNEIDYYIRKATESTREEVELSLTRKNSRYATIDLESLASELSEAERESLFSLSIDIAVKSWQKTRELCINELGLKCSVSYWRNYLMALMTGNAVKYFKNQTGESPSLVEMGAGSALLCIAAKIIDPYANVIGIENDDWMIDIGRGNLWSYGLLKEIKIIPHDFLNVNLDTCVDIVVNENISGDLVDEPLFPAVNAIRPYTHKNTLFVPRGVDIYFAGPIGTEGKHERVYIANVDFSEKLPDKITLAYTLPEGLSLPLHSLLDIGFDIFDFKGDTVVSKRKARDFDIQNLNLRARPKYIDVRRMQTDQRYKLKVVLDYEKNARLPIGNLVPEKV